MRGKNFYKLCEDKNKDSCKMKPNQCGIKIPEVKFITDRDLSGKEEDFIGNITYVGCDEAKKMSGKVITDRERSGKEEEFIGNITHVGSDKAQKICNNEKGNCADRNYLAIGVLSGVIAILLIANLAYFTVKRCRNQTERQVIHL